MSPTSRRLALGAAIALAAFGVALAETMPDHHGAGAPDMASMMTQNHHAPMVREPAAAAPTMPGQAAFGAIQEIVRILEANPETNWSKVDLATLREHLIDMDEVTLRATAAERPAEGGLAIAVTGSGRTLQAIQRMIPAHAREIDGLHGWRAQAAPLPDGTLLTVTATDPKEVAHIRGLGFIGLLASGAHHQPHHLAIATGERQIH